MRKTVKMKVVEADFGDTLEVILPRLIAKYGTQVEVAEHLGVSKATLAYWILKMGFRVERVLLKPDEIVKVVKREEAN